MSVAPAPRKLQRNLKRNLVESACGALGSFEVRVANGLSVAQINQLWSDVASVRAVVLLSSCMGEGQGVEKLLPQKPFY